MLAITTPSRVQALLDQCAERGRAAEAVQLKAGKPADYARAIGDVVRIGALEGALKYGALLPETVANGCYVMASRLGTALVRVEYTAVEGDPVITAALINGEWVPATPGVHFEREQLVQWEQAAEKDMQALRQAAREDQRIEAWQRSREFVEAQQLSGAAQ